MVGTLKTHSGSLDGQKGVQDYHHGPLNGFARTETETSIKLRQESVLPVAEQMALAKGTVPEMISLLHSDIVSKEALGKVVERICSDNYASKDSILGKRYCTYEPGALSWKERVEVAKILVSHKSFTDTDMQKRLASMTFVLMDSDMVVDFVSNPSVTDKGLLEYIERHSIDSRVFIALVKKDELSKATEEVLLNSPFDTIRDFASQRQKQLHLHPEVKIHEGRRDFDRAVSHRLGTG